MREWVGVVAVIAVAGCDGGHAVDAGTDGGVGVDGGRDLGADASRDLGASDGGGDAGRGAEAGVDLGADGGATDLGADAAACAGTLCGGACVDTTRDVANCGSCGHACAAAPAHGAPDCAASGCTFRCDAGYASDGSGCVNAPPRPVAPASTSIATTHRPTFRWRLGALSDGAHVDVCADRACSTVLATIDATGTAATPSADLPTGVVYWVLHGEAAGVVDSAASATWEVTIGPRDAAASAASGSVYDANGDGFADALVTTFDGPLAVYVGGPTGLAASATWSAPSPVAHGSGFGYSVASAGDVNGDGFADAVVGDDGTRAAFVYFGGPSGIPSSPSVTLPGPAGASSFGSTVAGCDVDADGYADVVVGSGSLTAFVYAGGPGGPSATPTRLTAGVDSFGTPVACAGDVNADGYADVVVGSTPTLVYLGGATGLDTATPITLTRPTGSITGFGDAVAGAGDVDGDGYADVIVGAPLAGSAYVFLGGPAGTTPAPATTLTGGSTSLLGWDVRGAGDVDGDGYADVLVSSHGTPAAEVHRGGAGGVSVAASTTLAIAGSTGFGVPVAGPGDVDGDGFADVLVVDGTARTVYVFGGSAGGTSATPTGTLVGSAAGFGFAIAALERAAASRNG